jgi:hypothetical protein
MLDKMRTTSEYSLYALVAQWIEHWPPKPCAQVRLLSGAPNAHPDIEKENDSGEDSVHGNGARHGRP